MTYEYDTKRDHVISGSDGFWLGLLEKFGLQHEKVVSMTITTDGCCWMHFAMILKNGITVNKIGKYETEFSKQLADALGFREGERFMVGTRIVVPSMGLAQVEILKAVDDRFTRIDWDLLQPVEEIVPIEVVMAEDKE